MLELEKRKVVATESAMTNFKSGDADIRALINRILTNLLQRAGMTWNLGI
jgi:hypothetical protein